MNIIIDDRERAVIPHFDSYIVRERSNIKYKVKRITAGDYAIAYNDKILLIIERKTWFDLAASMRDGRKDNINNLLDARNNTKCTLAYLIEGDPFPNPDKLYSRIPAKNLQAHLDHIAFRDNIHIIKSRGVNYTAWRIIEIAKNYIPIVRAMNKNCEDNISELTKPRDKLNISIQEQLIRCLPSVGSHIATCLAEANINLIDIYKCSVKLEDIARLKFPSGNSMGLDRARKIINNKRYIVNCCNTSFKYQVKILSCIPNISRKTAAFILRKYPLKDILDGKVTIDELAALIPNKRKLGKRIATNIIASLIPQNKPINTAENDKDEPINIENES